MPSRVLTPPMTPTDQNVRAAGVDAVIAAANAERLEDMKDVLLETGERLEEAGQDAPAAVLLLLSVVAVFSLNLDEPKKALQSPGRFGTIRFLGPEDLEDGHLDMLSVICQA